jgi:hypothetical protein
MIEALGEGQWLHRRLQTQPLSSVFIYSEYQENMNLL